MADFTIKGRDGLRIEGSFHKEKVDAKFKSKKTHGVSAELVGKINGTITAKPGDQLKKKIEKSTGLRSLFSRSSHSVKESTFKEVAKKAFDKLKAHAKDEGYSTSHMKLKVKYS